MLRKAQVWILAKAPDSTIRVLLLKLVDERGGHWQPVTGGVEEGESFAQGALREADEETGLRFLGKPLELEHEFRFQGRWGMAVERAFALWARLHAGRLPDPRLDPKEHGMAAWVLPEEALKRIPFSQQREALNKALKKALDASVGARG